MERESKLFIGIDLGWKDKKTTGICVLKEDGKIFFKDVFGKNVLKFLVPYLAKTSVIAVDAPLTLGRGKGKMRLFEKFFSTKGFRQEKIKPVPPAVMPKLWESAKTLLLGLEERGFSLGANLIETSVFLVKKIVPEEFIPDREKLKTENEESSFFCAKMAFLHSKLQTCYIGYKDGFLFLPAIYFWEKKWQEKFILEWRERNRLKYHYLATNIFENNAY